MSNIKNIIFDLGGVIIDVDMVHCFHQVEALGVDVQAIMKENEKNAKGPLAVVCDGITVGGVMEQYQVGGISTENFLGGLLQLSRPGTTMQQVIDAWNSCLKDLPQERLDFIRSLRSKYNVYLLSNTNDEHWRYIVEKHFSAPNQPAEYYFDKIFLSQEMHLAKPNPEIFTEVLHQIGAPADECLFIDDSTLNIQAAQQQGIHTIQATDALPYEAIRAYLA